MPGPFPGRVVSVAAPTADGDPAIVGAGVVREMVERGICALTGDSLAAAAWSRFVGPADVVGIKVNCTGHPHAVSSPLLVAEVARQVLALGLGPSQVVVFDRFRDQLARIGYERVLPAGVAVEAAEPDGPALAGYDPEVSVEAELGGVTERSHLMALVSRRLTRIVNVAVMKDHAAAGVTGCLKNIAFGCFSNVARAHRRGRHHLRTFVGTLAAAEPLRSRTVLQVLDGLSAVWHGGPFADARYVFHPRRILFGTDPVALDRVLLDVIDAKRREEGARSIWDRGPRLLVSSLAEQLRHPDLDMFVREPGHVEHAASLGLGLYTPAVEEIRL
jgi:uncharacterized protein (DUF362 family)